jgi:two-component system invasion response regulator UvrY
MENISILIVDDHKLIRETWHELLGTAGNIDIVGACGDGDTAVQLAKSTRPNIVLLDINMMPMNGIEVLKMIRKVSPGSRSIVVSMHSEPAYAKKLLRLGAKGFVTKNSPRDELLEAINSVWKGNIFVCAELQKNLDEDMAKNNTNLSHINCLSGRELQVLELLCAGSTSKDIAAALTIAIKTVDVHRYNILKKMKEKNMVSLKLRINASAVDW